LAVAVEIPKWQLTCKSGSDKDGRKAADSVDERSTWDAPVFASYVMALSVASSIDNDSDNDESNDHDDF
jgi:hypothetical protein